MRYKEICLVASGEFVYILKRRRKQRLILSYLCTLSHEDVVLGAALSTRDHQDKAERDAEKLNTTGSLS